MSRIVSICAWQSNEDADAESGIARSGIARSVVSDLSAASATSALSAMSAASSADPNPSDARSAVVRLDDASECIRSLEHGLERVVGSHSQQRKARQEALVTLPTEAWKTMKAAVLDPVCRAMNLSLSKFTGSDRQQSFAVRRRELQRVANDAGEFCRDLGTAPAPPAALSPPTLLWGDMRSPPTARSAQLQDAVAALAALLSAEVVERNKHIDLSFGTTELAIRGFAATAQAAVQQAAHQLTQLHNAVTQWTTAIHTTTGGSTVDRQLAAATDHHTRQALQRGLRRKGSAAQHNREWIDAGVDVDRKAALVKELVAKQLHLARKNTQAVATMATLPPAQRALAERDIQARVVASKQLQQQIFDAQNQCRAAESKLNAASNSVLTTPSRGDGGDDGQDAIKDGVEHGEQAMHATAIRGAKLKTYRRAMMEKLDLEARETRDSIARELFTVVQREFTSKQRAAASENSTREAEFLDRLAAAQPSKSELVDHAVVCGGEQDYQRLAASARASTAAYLAQRTQQHLRRLDAAVQALYTNTLTLTTPLRDLCASGPRETAP